MKLLLQLFQKIGSVFFAFLCLLALFQPALAQAAVNPSAQVSFVFDGGYERTYTELLLVLEDYYIRGTVYVPAGCIEGIGPCHQNLNPNAKYMTWSQIQDLKNTYGWEIGSQGLDHVRFTSLTPQEREYQLTQSNNLFEQKIGTRPQAFASPYGDVDYDTIAHIAKHHTSNRLSTDYGLNEWPYSDYYLSVKHINNGSDIQTVYRQIDEAINKKQWLIWVVDDISWPKLTAIAQYYKVRTGSIYGAAQISNVLTSDQTIAAQNLLTYAWTNEGGAEYWLTDDIVNVTEDTGNNGIAPYSQNAIKFTGNGSYSTLYTHQVAASDDTYYFKGYVDTRNMQEGSFLGSFIDEYDADGNWISWQWHGEIITQIASHIYTTYQRTSAAVQSFSIGTIFGGDINSFAFVDNYQVFNPFSNQTLPYPPTPANVPTEPRTPIPDPSPTPTATLTPIPTATPTPVPVGFKGEYFANQTMTGSPVMVRQDENIDFAWGDGSPDATVPVNQFSARWTKTETFESGTYEFVVTADDGFKLYIDNSLILDQWNDQAATTHTAEKVMTAGNHTMRVEYYEKRGDAVVKFSYTKKDVTPTSEPEVPAPTFVVYDETLPYTWNNWSWDSTVDFAATINPFKDNNHITLITNNYYAGLYLHTGLGFNTAGYKDLTFAVLATKPDQKMEILLLDENNKDLGTPKKLVDYGGDPVVGAYKTYTIPLADLNGSDKVIKGIILKDITGDIMNEIYIDAISFTAK